MFKNLLIHRLLPGWSPELVRDEAALQSQAFVPCGASQPFSSGWVPPRGEPHGPLIESVGGHWILQLRTEQRLLPASVVKDRMEEIAEDVERSTGRKPGKKQMRELKEQAVLELLPRAFTRHSHLRLWVDPQAGLLLADCASARRAEDALSLLVEAWPGFAVQLLQTQCAPATAMAAWLTEGQAPGDLALDRECELKAPDETKAVVRYARHALDIDEVREHIAQGKQPTRLALSWAGRVGFTLTEQGALRKIGFDDVVFEGKTDKADDGGFDADVAIATGELRRLVPALVEALDGELLPGQGPAPASPETVDTAAAGGPLPAVAASSPQAGEDLPPWA
ncbi:recombination-associated protein RdgC [Ideonella livida]|uniref:Recombination-associated protein RdgC n=1 Tax=Ideonella livida TaxID=2707176 RepID=A0A7C9THF3_9BURK|nr:recombination-associated protein RdgC [Ideonella livida]NDY89644.1 recombination-associated protein RdgC [Ideonella livida]